MLHADFAVYETILVVHPTYHVTESYPLEAVVEGPLSGSVIMVASMSMP